MKKHLIELDIDLYRIKIIMIIDTPEFFLNYMSTRFGVNYDLDEARNNAALTHIVEDKTYTSTAVIVIYTKDFKVSKTEYLSVLLHEVIHATAYVFESLGENINPNSEAFTYLAEHIFYELLTKIKGE